MLLFLLIQPRLFRVASPYNLLLRLVSLEEIIFMEELLVLFSQDFCDRALLIRIKGGFLPQLRFKPVDFDLETIGGRFWKVGVARGECSSSVLRFLVVNFLLMAQLRGWKNCGKLLNNFIIRPIIMPKSRLVQQVDQVSSLSRLVRCQTMLGHRLPVSLELSHKRTQHCVIF